MHKWKKWPINLINKNDLPDFVKSIGSFPDKLYIRGNWDNNILKNSMAIVGSRRMSRYGSEVVNKFMPDLVANNITIISGFMYGIDSEAHKCCLLNGGKTVAVLGGGLDYLSPVENDLLYSNILESGGIVMSEYEPDFQPTLWSFPQRNRIVSALSRDGVLVVEAGIKSGSLITAKFASKQGKAVYAIPGQVTSSTGEGVNWLIKSGLAKMVTEVADIISVKQTRTEQYDLFEQISGKEERQIIEWLRREQATIDELARGLGLTVSQVSILISGMLMKNLINEDAGKIYLNRF